MTWKFPIQCCTATLGYFLFRLRTPAARMWVHAVYTRKGLNSQYKNFKSGGKRDRQRIWEGNSVCNTTACGESNPLQYPSRLNPNYDSVNPEKSSEYG
jgi:hypothetical protein